ncbi:hypothetical protein GOP47_0008810 [Adiantum capillus-veneris]|uniref:C2H2-type domain-containing protein n=1 Tax=Adiantum capillus-veneris TaxID=13818 RepID=A0A9D4UZN9_ADICA|nr:hypothetical protein GOP47_0008810 [Adiantum capillus-veneris]
MSSASEHASGLDLMDNSSEQGLQALQAVSRKKRNLPGTPDPDAEVIALSPRTLMATNRFVCEVCGKGFQRDQNLQLHRRGHNLPWRLKQREEQEIKKRVYVCPEIGKPIRKSAEHGNIDVIAARCFQEGIASSPIGLFVMP